MKLWIAVANKVVNHNANDNSSEKNNVTGVAGIWSYKGFHNCLAGNRNAKGCRFKNATVLMVLMKKTRMRKSPAIIWTKVIFLKKYNN